MGATFHQLLPHHILILWGPMFSIPPPCSVPSFSRLAFLGTWWLTSIWSFTFGGCFLVVMVISNGYRYESGIVPLPNYLTVRRCVDMKAGVLKSSSTYTTGTNKQSQRRHTACSYKLREVATDKTFREKVSGGKQKGLCSRNRISSTSSCISDRIPRYLSGHRTQQSLWSSLRGFC